LIPGSLLKFPTKASKMVEIGQLFFLTYRTNIAGYGLYCTVEAQDGEISTQLQVRATTDNIKNIK
jgi:hypothetical protein